jgi:hypothetical protein
MKKLIDKIRGVSYTGVIGRCHEETTEKCTTALHVSIYINLENENYLYIVGYIRNNIEDFLRRGVSIK